MVVGVWAWEGEQTEDLDNSQFNLALVRGWCWVGCVCVIVVRQAKQSCLPVLTDLSEPHPARAAAAVAAAGEPLWLACLPPAARATRVCMCRGRPLGAQGKGRVGGIASRMQGGGHTLWCMTMWHYIDYSVECLLLFHLLALEMLYSNHIHPLSILVTVHLRETI